MNREKKRKTFENKVHCFIKVLFINPSNRQIQFKLQDSLV